MANGKLGTAVLAANESKDIYTVPAGKVMTVNVLMANTGQEAASVRLALVPGTAADLTLEHYIEYGAGIPVGGILERSALVLSPGETVVAWSDKSSVSVRVHGYEEA